MVDFPRGGGNELTPLEIRQVNDKAKRDFLFAEVDSDTEKETKHKKIKLTHDSLNFKRLAVGMTLFGVIKKLNQLDIEISLPNQLTGYINITEISDRMTELVETSMDGEGELPELDLIYHIGQPLIFTLILIDNKRLELSLNPLKMQTKLILNTIQNCTILEKEDYGYTVSLGASSGFYKTKKSLSIGCTLSLSVEKVEPLILCDSYEKPISKDIDINDLTAGQLLNCKLIENSKNGLAIVETCLGNTVVAYNGKKGDKLKSRIVYKNEKSFGISANLNVVGFLDVNFEATYGQIMRNLQVSKVDQKLGVTLNIGGGEKGYCHISNLSDTRVETIDMKEGDRCVGRVIGFDFVGGLVVFSLAPKTIAQPFMKLDEITPGALIKAKVKKVEDYGVIVEVTEHINGLCPTLNLSDAKLKNPEKLFKVGKLMEFRVVTSDAESKKLILTAKKSMLNVDCLSEYSDAKRGDIYFGVITAIKEFGCIVTYFNNVKALCPKHSMSLDGGQVVMENYKIGQTVKTQIVKPGNEKIMVSFRILDFQKLQKGVIGECKIIKSTEGGVMVEFGDGTVAFVAVNHLSDHLMLSEKIHQRYLEFNSKKPIICGVGMVTGVDSKGVVSATLKPLVIKYNETKKVLSFRDLEVDEVAVAVVKGITESLCFVEIGGITAVANIQVFFTN
jgi:rRNA biogenesis protein RRP5